jgi:restriction system protein
MAVPGFQDMFIHFLRSLADGEPKHTSDVQKHIVQALEISEEDQEDMIPSGQTTRLANRVGWARTHLNKAGLIQRVDWGIYKITDEGRKIVESPPEKLDLKFLDTIPRHKEWFHKPRRGPKTTEANSATPDQPPNERIEEAFKEINDSLATELQDLMAKMDPFQFEQLVVDLLFAMGYGGSRAEAAKVTKKSNDEGIDGVINEDRLGLDTIYVQAKRWQNTVGRKEIQSFVGALAGKAANKGVFITTSSFAESATEYANTVAQKVILIDGDRLADLMIEHNIGVSTTRTLALKRVDSDYFAEN